jgi:hypothetical protein
MRLLLSILSTSLTRMRLVVSDRLHQGFHSGQILHPWGILHTAGGVESIWIHGSL